MIDISNIARLLEQKTMLFEATLSTITDLVYIFDCDGRFLYANKPLLDLWGLKAEEAIGKTMAELGYAKEVEAQVLADIREVFDTKRRLTGETPYTSPRGHSGYYEYILNPFFARDGSVESIVGSTRDVSGRKLSEEKLRMSEERFRAMFEQANVGIVQTTIDGHLLTPNPGFCHFIGYTEEEVRHLTVRDVSHSDDYEREIELTRQLIEGEIPGYSIEKRYLRKDGSIVWGNMTATLVRHATGEPFYPLIIVEDISERKAAEEALYRAHDEMEARVRERTSELMFANDALHTKIIESVAAEDKIKNLLKQLVTIQEDERRRIARDLHDHLGQQLTALQLNLESLKESCGASVDLYEQVTRTQNILKQLDGDVDFLAWELRPVALDDLGITVALTNFVQEWSRHFSIPAEFHTRSLEKGRLAPEIETNLYRIAQEALNNICKHANATCVDMFLEQRDGHTVLIVEDDGDGFDLNETAMPDTEDRGMGLIGMRERAALVGGTLEIETTPGEGATIFVRIPVSYAQDGGTGE